MNVKARQNGLYAAFISKDARFDGRFFVAISSTGIYCRPVCRARTPKEANCSFYETAAEAEQAGYRPCLLCRPELAPGRSITDATSNLARRAARLLEEDCRSGQSLDTLAGRLGCTDRHLRRVFTAEYRIPPVQYLQTCRLLLAKNLLTDTDLPVVDVAMASGFGSLRRFNDLFKKHYSLSPTALRRQSAVRGNQQNEITLQLGYRPPYRWQELLQFLRRHASPGTEAVQEDAYYRTVHHTDARGKELFGWVKVGNNHGKNSLSVTVSEALIPVMPQVLARIRHLFDLYCEPDAVYETLASMNNVRPGLCIKGTRLPGSYDAFELAAQAIFKQAGDDERAVALTGRIVQELGKPLETGINGLTHAFPTPEDMLASKKSSGLSSLGATPAESRAVENLAHALAAGEITLDMSSDPEKEAESLLAIEGIGSWTAQYIAMRTMEWPDVFLQPRADTDIAYAPTLFKQVAAKAEDWRPWRSYATVNLWHEAYR